MTLRARKAGYKKKALGVAADVFICMLIKVTNKNDVETGFQFVRPQMADASNW